MDGAMKNLARFDPDEHFCVLPITGRFDQATGFYVEQPSRYWCRECGQIWKRDGGNWFQHGRRYLAGVTPMP